MTTYGLVGLLCFALTAAAVNAATQYRVGGDKGWSVPNGTAEPYNTWSSRMRFLIGDQLLFVYPAGTDSVLLVDQGAYNACNTTTYVTKFEGGSTVFTLDRSGPFFFISGNQASCTANQKLIVVVISADHTPPGLLPTPPPSMPPTSAAPEPSPSSPPSPPSMAPPSGAPMPSPMSPPSMAPPSGAPMPSPMSPPSMAPPTGTPMPSPMSPPSGAPMPTPESAPSPTGSAPGTAPAGTPGSSPSSSPGTPGSGGAAALKAGLISTLAAGFGYAMLAI